MEDHRKQWKVDENRWKSKEKTRRSTQKIKRCQQKKSNSAPFSNYLSPSLAPDIRMFVFSCRHAFVSQFGSWCQLIGMSLNLCVALFGWWCPAFRIYLLMVCLHYLPACLGLPSSLDCFFYLSPLICLAACLVLLPGSPLFPCLASGVRLFGCLFLVFACLAS